ncbi:TraR/DksA family transcriptional regulator [Phytohabitans kaempferiae]|uniref:TraR/DksA family transcriptional regulator n=1 Tax=Phytohabitans kaempferiae TaxID=1620943 RepID=A0ABV6M9I7_9ACTN
MTVNANSRMPDLQVALEEQVQRYTEELAALSTHGASPENAGLDRATVTARADTTRQALADAAQALKRMADGTYGRCERCDGPIPAERLEIRPHARFCVPCQQLARG